MGRTCVASCLVIFAIITEAEVRLFPPARTKKVEVQCGRSGNDGSRGKPRL
jgi:hypothetical protein